jgi:nicotinamide-nucleotide amidase
MPISDDLIGSADRLLDELRAKGLTLSCAESCTGGLISASLTEIAGSSDVFERGFITYSNEAKSEMLGVPEQLIVAHGAVSQDVVVAMAEGALMHSRADLAVAVTGIAGPGGGSEDKPVGLVFIAAARRDGPVTHLRCTFGDVGRSTVRKCTVVEAFRLVHSLI